MVGLDPQGSRLIKEIFKSAAHDQGMAVFLSTHSLETAEEVCDRVGILLQGQWWLPAPSTSCATPWQATRTSSPSSAHHRRRDQRPGSPLRWTCFETERRQRRGLLIGGRIQRARAAPVRSAGAPAGSVPRWW